MRRLILSHVIGLDGKSSEPVRRAEFAAAIRVTIRFLRSGV